MAPLFGALIRLSSGVPLAWWYAVSLLGGVLLVRQMAGDLAVFWA